MSSRAIIFWGGLQELGSGLFLNGKASQILVKPKTSCACIISHGLTEVKGCRPFGGQIN